MNKSKLQTLIYDLQRTITLEESHELVMQYLEVEQEAAASKILVRNMVIDFTGAATVEVRLKIEIPKELFKNKTWTIDNVLA